MTCTVTIQKRHSPSVVGAAVQQALTGFLDPLKGGIEGQGWPFGRPVFPAEIYQVIEGVEGVDYVTGLSLSAEGEYQEDGGVFKIPPLALVYSGDHQIAIRE